MVVVVVQEMGPGAPFGTPGPTPSTTAGQKTGTARQGTQRRARQWARGQPLFAGIVASRATDNVTARSSVVETKPGPEVGGVRKLKRLWPKPPS